MRPKVSIIILNWNGWVDTIEYLESVFQNSYPAGFGAICIYSIRAEVFLRRLRSL